jgi:ABC-type phosphate transport system substrate-binding protein
MPARLAISAALIIALTALCATVFGQQHSPPPPPYQVIVHPRNAEVTVERKFLEDAFLKKITTWPNDDVIRPADLAPDSPVRRAFTRDVLNRSVEAVKGYWQQRIFSGRDVPPPEFQQDEDVVQFVLKHEGGVGYVSGTAKINGCKVLVVR